MNTLSHDLKITFIIAIIIMIFFVGFIILIVFLYNRKQLFYLKEKELKESEHENQLLIKELERQKAIQQERERISHDMHDDLGTGISAIKLHTEFLKNKIKDAKYNQDFEDILKTSEEMNISMREILWSLNDKNNTIGNFVEYCINFSDYFFRKHPIKIEYYRNELSLDLDVGNEKRRNLFLCFKEALHNVYKHSNATELNINFAQKKEKFFIIIQDNGIGFTEVSSQGNGLKNMKKRMEDISGEFLVSSISSGTTLTFSIVLNV